MWTEEKVLDGFRNMRAMGKVRGRGSIYGMKVTLESSTVARTEIGKDSSVMPVKGQLRGINFRRDIYKKGLGAEDWNLKSLALVWFVNNIMIKKNIYNQLL